MLFGSADPPYRASTLELSLQKGGKSPHVRLHNRVVLFSQRILSSPVDTVNRGRPRMGANLQYSEALGLVTSRWAPRPQVAKKREASRKRAPGRAAHSSRQRSLRRPQPGPPP